MWGMSFDMRAPSFGAPRNAPELGRPCLQLFVDKVLPVAYP
jgi:hypothetical protein